MTESKDHVSNLKARITAYLQSGDRETAARFALELRRTKEELTENLAQLEMHETAYENNLSKIKHASGKLGSIKDKISRYDAELRMSRAEAEIADTFKVDITTDFGQIEDVLQDKIGLNRAKARVAADLSQEGIADIEKERAMEAVLAEDALKDFEIELGLITPQTAKVSEKRRRNLGHRRRRREQPPSSPSDMNPTLLRPAITVGPLGSARLNSASGGVHE